jgi:hypothetical protein
MKKYILLIFIFLNEIGWAQVINLTCINPRDNFTMTFNLDEKNGYVYQSGVRYSAIFNNSEIIFSIKHNNGNEWLHVISRTTGNLMVQNNADKFILPVYKCTVADKKF